MPVLSPSDIKKRFEKLKSDRSTWESHWQEIANYMNPMRNDFTTTIQPGSKRNVQILDNTAMMASELLAGALSGMLTNASTPWLEFETEDRKLNANKRIKTWLQMASNKVLDVMNGSNFQTEVHQFYLDLTSICTAAMQIEEDVDRVARFSSQHIGTLYIEEDNKGMVSEVYRSFKWPVRYIVQEFGEASIKDQTQLMSHYEKNSDEKFEIIHAVYPREKVGDSPFPIISKYILCHSYSAGEPALLSEGGFNEMSYVVSRWSKASGEKYGRGPGMTALPEQKVLNKMVETTIKGAQKSVDPPLIAPDDGVVLPLKLHPGGLNFKRAGSDDIKPIFDNYRVDFGFQAMESHRKRVREAFYVDQLQMAEGPQKTATEVLQTTEEKMRLLGPLLGRQEFEFLTPVVDRVYGIMNRRGMFDPIPDELKGKLIRARYISTIARSQRVGELNSMLKGIQALAPVAQLMPEVVDNFDSDGYFQEVARIQAFPNAVMRDKDQVKQLRDARHQGQQQQLQQQQQAQNVDNQTKIAKATQ